MHVPKLRSERVWDAASQAPSAVAGSSWPQLDVRVERAGAAFEVTCRGGLVSDTAPALRRAVGGCIEAGAETITLDLRGVVDVDVVGVRAAIEAGDVCSEQEIELTIAMASRTYHLYCLANPSARGRTLRRRLQQEAPAAARSVTVIGV